MAVVLITGCSSGFGEGAALAFARRGDTVYATMRNPERGALLGSTAANEALSLEVLQLDVDDDNSVRRAVDAVLDRSVHIDVLVNNAGIGGTAKPIEMLTDDEWMQVISTNVLGPIRTARAVVPAMRANGSGVIINVSSIAGRVPGTPITAPYAVSKHALCCVSDSLHGELEPFGISVVCIEPGMFATQIIDKTEFPPVTGTPYESMAAAMQRWYRAGAGGGADPQIVVDEILRSADEPAGETIHRPIGDDAELYLATISSMTYAEWRAMGRKIVGLD